jgi:hypothetical protein
MNLHSSMETIIQGQYYYDIILFSDHDWPSRLDAVEIPSFQQSLFTYGASLDVVKELTAE